MVFMFLHCFQYFFFCFFFFFFQLYPQDPNPGARDIVQEMTFALHVAVTLAEIPQIVSSEHRSRDVP